jgi:hypothetical protein
MAQWTERAGQGERSSVRAPPGRIGEMPCEAVEGIPECPRKDTEFETKTMSRVAFSEAKYVFNYDRHRSRLKILLSFQKVDHQNL